LWRRPRPKLGCGAKRGRERERERWSNMGNMNNTEQLYLQKGSITKMRYCLLNETFLIVLVVWTASTFELKVA
jgi:hypothetical protein